MVRFCYCVEHQFIVEPREWWVTLEIVRTDICRTIVATSGSMPFGNNRGARYQMHTASDTEQNVHIESFCISFIILSKFAGSSPLHGIVSGRIVCCATCSNLTCLKGNNHYDSFCIILYRLD